MIQSRPTEPIESPATSRRARGRPPDEAKHAAILAAARELFFSGGPRRLTMEAVARAAGVSKVTVYAHFNDLPGLIRAVILAQRARMTQTLDDLPTDAETLRQRLVEFGHGLMIYLTSDEFLTLQRLLAAQAPQHPWLGPIVYQEGAEATWSKLAGLLAAAVERGDLRPHDSLLAAEQLLGMWQGFQATALMIGGCPKPTSEVLRVRIERSVDLILAAHAPTRSGDCQGDQTA
ncbi:TetR/AcrR family transcriptional regulator [Thiocystis violacea]|uniref:TetR/AcrR family transcriptional regulator n=1 Tax=Thiocystis violacea TaxID=13725 RepID=UPI001903E71A|nr:TetR/AcrR family transcriptional regulator [Thiocystis violacea]MBK1718544.1 TetR family transcriptional regulator [Thiocystis violacea]